MEQGGLFCGNERTNELSTADGFEQSQTKVARYHRAYRKDPEKNRKINEARRKTEWFGRVRSWSEKE